jgi:hypothetical protein
VLQSGSSTPWQHAQQQRQHYLVLHLVLLAVMSLKTRNISVCPTWEPLMALQLVVCVAIQLVVPRLTARLLSVSVLAASPSSWQQQQRLQRSVAIKLVKTIWRHRLHPQLTAS